MKRIKVIPIIALAATLLGCTSRGPDVSEGECITPVDGMQIYKVTRVEGKSLHAQPVGGADTPTKSSEMMVPETMHYVTIDCP